MSKPLQIKDIEDDKLRELALSRCSKGKGLNDKLITAFEWEYTPEGHKFWWDVDTKIITKLEDNE